MRLVIRAALPATVLDASTAAGAVPQNRGERSRIAQIVAQERALGCPNDERIVQPNSNQRS